SNGYTVSRSRITTENDNSALFLKDQKYLRGGEWEDFFFIASIKDGALKLNAKLVDHDIRHRSRINGKAAVLEAIEHFGTDKFKYISGEWHPGSDNQQMFRRSFFEGFSAPEAALRTWTGKQVTEHGYSRVAMIELIEADLDRFKGIAPYSPVADDFSDPAIFPFERFVVRVQFHPRETVSSEPTDIESPLLIEMQEGGQQMLLKDPLFGFEMLIRFAADRIEFAPGAILENQHGWSNTLFMIRTHLENINFLLNPANQNDPRRPSRVENLRLLIEQMETVSLEQTEFETTVTVLKRVFEAYKFLVDKP
ncbi:MAG: hypothetical protein AAF202_03405, partial [Pseudomonadota bacterium]